VTHAATVEELSGDWVSGLSGADAREAQQLLGALVADWSREADTAPVDVRTIQRQELAEAGRGKSPREKLDLLRSEVTKRRINRLSGQSYALGSQIVDGKIDLAAARTQGKALLEAVDALNSDVKAIQDAGVQRRLQRDLNEVRMEALYAVEHKAMSLRLNRYQQDRKR
jgi:hypothetical protein